MFTSPIFLSLKVANQFFLIPTFPINLNAPTVFLFLRLRSLEQDNATKPGTSLLGTASLQFEMQAAALPDCLASELRIQTSSLAREHYVFT